MENKENFFISQFKNSKVIGDDAAVIGKWVYSADAFFEDIHFKRDWFSLKQIAVKAMLVNISDTIVMNAKPKYALLTVSIPKDFTNDDLKELSSGFKKIAKKFELEIIGGDTIAGDKLNISVTIIGKTKDPIYRKGMKVNDIVCYTGTLGESKKDLDKLLKGKKVDKNSKFIKPKLQQNFFYEIAPYINSALDISDGLFFELERLSKINNLGFYFKEKIDKEVGCSGEEYEILFTFDKNKKERIKKIAKKYGVKLNFVAVAVEGKYRCPCKAHHF
jgi:thiamine-monophosphate kinase